MPECGAWHVDSVYVSIMHVAVVSNREKAANGLAVFVEDSTLAVGGNAACFEEEAIAQLCNVEGALFNSDHLLGGFSVVVIVSFCAKFVVSRDRFFQSFAV